MRKLLAIALLFAAIVEIAASNPPAPAPAKPADQEQKSATKPGNSAAQKEGPSHKTALSVELLNTGKSAEERQQETNSEQGRASREWWAIGISFASLFVTIALAVITGLLAKYTYLLWKATDRIVKDSEKMANKQAADMRESLDISKQSADAARKSADIAEVALKDLERPYVFWSHLDGSAITPPGMPLNMYPSANTTHTPIVVCSFINAGRTPAIMQSIWAKLVLIDKLPEQPDFSGAPGFLSGSGIFLASIVHPNVSVPMNEEITLSGEDWKKIDVKRFFFLYGRIRYSSIFGDQYVTRFGLRYVRPGKEAGFFPWGGHAYNRDEKVGKSEGNTFPS